LVLGYVRETGQVSAETMMRAEHLVNMGYQKLLAFQRPKGGFDWWGRGPSLTFLTAYAIQEFHDIAKVHDIDPKIIEKARNFLFSVQEKDGSWIRAGATHGLRIQQLPPEALTAYIAWSILETGFRDARLDRALAWLEKRAKEPQDDNYILALMANAFLAKDKSSETGLAILKTLADRAREDGDTVFWPVKGQTMYYGSGSSGNVETTGLVTYAMIQARRHPGISNKALAYLVKARRGNGAGGSTQATILALKAILKASSSGGEMKSNAEITVEVNGKKKHVIITPEEWDVMQLLDFKDAAKEGNNKIEIRFGGEVNLSYQILGRYFIPWSKLPRDDRPEPIELSVAYDKTELTTHDVVRATANMRYNGTRPTYMVIVTLGIPPGFLVDRGDLVEMVGMGRIERFDLNPRQATLYIGDVKPGQKFEFVYHLVPKYPIKAKSAKSEAYEYYNPDNKTVVEPEKITVK
jgi:uncharacterized protein YfaS (alpha-2-macroglobulin family)